MRSTVESGSVLPPGRLPRRACSRQLDAAERDHRLAGVVDAAEQRDRARPPLTEVPSAPPSVALVTAAVAGRGAHAAAVLAQHRQRAGAQAQRRGRSG
jgi:hypothetical protein